MCIIGFAVVLFFLHFYMNTYFLDSKNAPKVFRSVALYWKLDKDKVGTYFEKVIFDFLGIFLWRKKTIKNVEFPRVNAVFSSYISSDKISNP